MLNCYIVFPPKADAPLEQKLKIPACRQAGKIFKMGKYLIVYKNSLSTFLQYRLNLGLLSISHLVSLSGLIYLWVAVYSSGQQVGNYTLAQLIIYYILLTILRLTIADGIGMGFQVTEEINQGLITNYLLRPFSYTGEQFFKLLGQVSINFLFVTPAVLFLIWLGSDYFSWPALAYWLRFAVMIGLGFVFYFLVFYLAALSAFWVQRGGHFIYGMILISALLDGSLLPLDLFPAWFQNLNNYSPFPYLMFLPIQAFLGRIENWAQTIGLAMFWILILAGLLALVWRRGVKKFEAVGR